MDMMQLPAEYHREMPDWLARASGTRPMQRLKQVGMNCGCEYTSFPRFRGLRPYSRFQHSVGAALIVWHFTASRKQTLAALFHDIATPVFAHTVDFLYGDHLRQEYTEGRTEELLRASDEITALLEAWGISLASVSDYHQYPIADNDSPRLSADRLEYTLGNLRGYGKLPRARLQAYYDDLEVLTAPDGAPELGFASESLARDFARDALEMSKIYVADPDRYAMQRLAELLKRAMERGVLTPDDLYTTEPQVIALLEGDAELQEAWERYCALHTMARGEEAPMALRRVIHAKKRFIDPLAKGRGRVSQWDGAFRAALDAFLAQSQDGWICGI